jgi:hypothetical protein
LTGLSVLGVFPGAAGSKRFADARRGPAYDTGSPWTRGNDVPMERIYSARHPGLPVIQWPRGGPVLKHDQAATRRIFQLPALCRANARLIVQMS